MVSNWLSNDTQEWINEYVRGDKGTISRQVPCHRKVVCWLDGLHELRGIADVEVTEREKHSWSATCRLLQPQHYHDIKYCEVNWYGENRLKCSLDSRFMSAVVQNEIQVTKRESRPCRMAWTFIHNCAWQCSDRSSNFGGGETRAMVHCSDKSSSERRSSTVTYRAGPSAVMRTSTNENKNNRIVESETS